MKFKYLVLPFFFLLLIVSVSAYQSTQSPTSCPLLNASSLWRNCTSAYANGGGYANGSSQLPAWGLWENYGFDFLYSDWVINGLRVRADAWANNTCDPVEIFNRTLVWTGFNYHLVYPIQFCGFFVSSVGSDPSTVGVTVDGNTSYLTNGTSQWVNGVFVEVLQVRNYGGYVNVTVDSTVRFRKSNPNAVQIQVNVSRDGGNTWGPGHITNLTVAEKIYWFNVINDFDPDQWGVVWWPMDLWNGNFIVSVQCLSQGSINNKCNLDWLPTEVTYTIPPV
ncbi:hypothetical protein HZB00_02850 [Candidatus Woesearchaeota archaeon]|nr:hypothetical protein [Candidatus Woesearchaeota archaeon]